VDNVLTWIRSKKEDSKEPTDEFKKIDQLMPAKRGQPSENRARDIESALDWMRNKRVLSPTTRVALLLTSWDRFPCLAAVQRIVPGSKDVDDALTWLRNGKADSEIPLAISRRSTSCCQTRENQRSFSLFHLSRSFHRNRIGLVQWKTERKISIEH
jgi:hypothetical protein